MRKFAILVVGLMLMSLLIPFAGAEQWFDENELTFSRESNPVLNQSVGFTRQVSYDVDTEVDNKIESVKDDIPDHWAVKGGVDFSASLEHITVEEKNESSDRTLNLGTEGSTAHYFGGETVNIDGYVNVTDVPDFQYDAFILTSTSQFTENTSSSNNVTISDGNITANGADAYWESTIFEKTLSGHQIRRIVGSATAFGTNYTAYIRQNSSVSYSQLGFVTGTVFPQFQLKVELDYSEPAVYPYGNTALGIQGEEYYMLDDDGTIEWNGTTDETTDVEDLAYYPDGGMVFVTDKDDVVRYDSSGTQLWNVDVEDDTDNTAITVDADGDVYVGTNGGHIKKLSGSDGSQLAYDSVSGTVGELEWHNSYLYCAEPRADLSSVWRFPEVLDGTYSRVDFSTDTQGMSVDANGNVYVGVNGELVRCDLSSESKDWTKTIADGGNLRDIDVDSDYIYLVNSTDDTVQKWNIGDSSSIGSRAWSWSYTGSGNPKTLSVGVYGMVAVGDDQGYVYWLKTDGSVGNKKDVCSGKTRPDIETIGTAPHDFALNPSAYEATRAGDYDIAYNGQINGMLDQTGEIEWENSGISAYDVCLNENKEFYFACGSFIRKYDSSGTLLWEYSVSNTPNAIDVSSRLINDNFRHVVTSHGNGSIVMLDDFGNTVSLNNTNNPEGTTKDCRDVALRYDSGTNTEYIYYTTDNNAVGRVNEDLTVNWRGSTPFASSTIECVIDSDNGVITADNDGVIVKYDASGTKQWEKSTGSSCWDLSINDNWVYSYNTGDTEIQVRDKSTGAQDHTVSINNNGMSDFKVDADGNIYTTNGGDQYVRKYKADGTLVVDGSYSDTIRDIQPFPHNYWYSASSSDGTDGGVTGYLSEINILWDDTADFILGGTAYNAKYEGFNETFSLTGVKSLDITNWYGDVTFNLVYDVYYQPKTDENAPKVPITVKFYNASGGVMKEEVFDIGYNSPVNTTISLENITDVAYYKVFFEPEANDFRASSAELDFGGGTIVVELAILLYYETGWSDFYNFVSDATFWAIFLAMILTIGMGALTRNAQVSAIFFVFLIGIFTLVGYVHPFVLYVTIFGFAGLYAISVRANRSW